MCPGTPPEETVMNIVDAGIGLIAGMVLLFVFDFFFYKNSKTSVNSSEFFETIESLRSELEQAKAAAIELDEAKAKIKDLEAKLAEGGHVMSEATGEPGNDSTILLLREEISALEAKNTAKDLEIQDLHTKIASQPQFPTDEADTLAMEERILELENALREKNATINSLQAAPVSSEGDNEALLERIGALEAGLAAKDAKIHELQVQNNRPLVSEVDDSRVRKLEAEVAKKDVLEERLVVALQELEDLRMSASRPQPKADTGPSEALVAQLAQQESDINNLKLQVAVKEEDLRTIRKELENEKIRVQVLLAGQSTMKDDDMEDQELIRRHPSDSPALQLIEEIKPTPELSQQIVEEALEALQAKKPTTNPNGGATNGHETSASATKNGSHGATAVAVKQGGRAGRDTLEKIDGIGPVYQAKLWEAGVHKYADLAALTPERVLEIIQPKDWQHIDAELWIKEASEFESGERV